MSSSPISICSQSWSSSVRVWFNIQVPCTNSTMYSPESLSKIADTGTPVPFFSRSVTLRSGTFWPSSSSLNVRSEVSGTGVGKLTEESSPSSKK